MATSQNGYTANDPSRVSSRLVPGTSRRLTVVKGPPGDLLLHWAAWFDEHVEDIDEARGALDDWGYAERPIRGSATELSNHASGTAIDLNATRHPLDHRGTFTTRQAATIRAELARYDGAIRWGGDYQRRADEMHFEIVTTPQKCAAVLARLTKETPVNPATPPAPVDRLDRCGDMLREALPLLEQATRFTKAALDNLARLDWAGIPPAGLANIEGQTEALRADYATVQRLAADVRHRAGLLPRTDREARS